MQSSRKGIYLALNEAQEQCDVRKLLNDLKLTIINDLGDQIVCEARTKLRLIVYPNERNYRSYDDDTSSGSYADLVGYRHPGAGASEVLNHLEKAQRSDLV